MQIKDIIVEERRRASDLTGLRGPERQKNENPPTNSPNRRKVRWKQGGQWHQDRNEQLNPTGLTENVEGVDPFIIKPEPPIGWKQAGRNKTVPGMAVTLKTTEPRGVPAEIIRNMGFQAVSYVTGKVVGPFKIAGIKEVYTLAGAPLHAAIKKVRWNNFKPSGLVFVFDYGVNEADGVGKLRTILDAFKQKAYKQHDRKEKRRASAPDRAKAAAAQRRPAEKAAREELYNKYGKYNVQSVSTRQINGDDGYHWAVLINGRPMVDGLTYQEVQHYKIDAYKLLLAKFGKR